VNQFGTAQWNKLPYGVYTLSRHETDRTDPRRGVTATWRYRKTITITPGANMQLDLQDKSLWELQKEAHNQP